MAWGPGRHTGDKNDQDFSKSGGLSVAGSGIYGCCVELKGIAIEMHRRTSLRDLDGRWGAPEACRVPAMLAS